METRGELGRSFSEILLNDILAECTRTRVYVSEYKSRDEQSPVFKKRKKKKEGEQLFVAVKNFHASISTILELSNIVGPLALATDCGP